MKKILVPALILCLAQVAKAQHSITSQQLDAAIARRAAVFTLTADKNLVDLNEATAVRVKILVYNRPPAEAGPNDVNFDIDYDYDTSNPSSEPYKIQNWHILEANSGHLTGTNDVANYIAPTSMPASHSATISVDLVPNRPGLPKIQLLQVINIEDAPMAFTFDAPGAGINNEKYTFSNAGSPDALAGIKLPPGASANAEQMAKLAALQAQLAQVRGQAGAAAASKGYNLDALMSNAKAIYTASSDITVIQIMGQAKVTKAGKDAGTKNVMITLTFPGKNNGLKYLKSNKGIAAHIILDQKTAFGCENDPQKNPQETGIHCAGGIINVSAYDGTQVKGTIHAQLEGFNCNGTLDGKFIAKVANQ